MLDMREKRRGLVGLSWCLATTCKASRKRGGGVGNNKPARGDNNLYLWRVIWLRTPHKSSSKVYVAYENIPLHQCCTPHDTEIHVDSENWKVEKDLKFRRADR